MTLVFIKTGAQGAPQPPQPFPPKKGKLPRQNAQRPVGGFAPVPGTRFRFVAKPKPGWNGIVNCEVVEAREPTLLRYTWTDDAGGDTTVVTYSLEPAGDGTDVTESFHLADTALLKLYWTLLGWSRGRTNRNDMRTTLERVKADTFEGESEDRAFQEAAIFACADAVLASHQAACRSEMQAPHAGEIGQRARADKGGHIADSVHGGKEQAVVAGGSLDAPRAGAFEQKYVDAVARTRCTGSLGCAAFVCARWRTAASCPV